MGKFENSIEEINRSKMADMMEFIDQEITRRIKDFPIRVFIGGDEVDISDQTMIGEEIHISVECPMFFSKTGKLGFVTIEMPKKMAQ